MRRDGRTALSPFLILTCGLFLFAQNSFADVLIESEAGLENSSAVKLGFEANAGVLKIPDGNTVLRIKRAPLGMSVCLYFVCVKPALEFSFIDIDLDESVVSAKMNSQTGGGDALKNIVLGGTLNITTPPEVLGDIRWLQFGASLDGRTTVLRNPLDLTELNVGATDMLEFWKNSIAVSYRWSAVSGAGFMTLRAPWPAFPAAFSAAGGAVRLSLDVDVTASRDGETVTLPHDAQGRNIVKVEPLVLLRLGLPIGRLLGLNVSGMIIPYEDDVIYTVEGGVAFRI